MISLIITFGTVLYTYLSLSLPREVYNPFDALVIPKWLVKKCLPEIVPEGHRTKDPQTTKQKNLAALTNLILTMSDQHLVTGTAMLIASYAIALGAGGLDTQKSVYSLRVATSLATLAAIAHISTLFVLRFRFKERHTDTDVRLIILLVLILLTIGARLRITSTSIAEDPQCVAQSSVKKGLLESSDRNMHIRVTATIMEILGLLICLYSSVKAYLHVPAGGRERKERDPATPTMQVDGLRSFVRSYILGRELTTQDVETIQTSYDKLLRGKPPYRLIFTVMALSSSSLVKMLWLLLFFIYGLVELFWTYASRSRHNAPPVITEPSFGQLMPILILSGSLLGVLTTWIGMWLSIPFWYIIHADYHTEIYPSRDTQNTPRNFLNKVRRWIKNTASKTTKEDEIDLESFLKTQAEWLQGKKLRKHSLLDRKNRSLAWAVFFIGITTMMAVVVARIAGHVYRNAPTVGNQGLIWDSIFIGAVGLYFALHILFSIALGARDARILR